MLSGDSAGGNLILGLTVMAIEKGVIILFSVYSEVIRIFCSICLSVFLFVMLI